MKRMRLAALALLILGGSCRADLEGAPCPCIEPQYRCTEGVCVRRGQIDGGGLEPDAGPDVPDAQLGDADGGPADGGPGSPDAEPI